MAESNFIDYVKICCRSGKGGAGSAHMHRAKGLPNGGPDGGDGGRGGHIILVGNKQLWTLLHLQYQKHVIAGHGEGGGASNCTGAQGEDIILEVPLGTIARDAETGEVRAEVVEDGQRITLTPGGRGGLGNSQFTSATRQAPTYAQPGEPGQEVWNILELKLLADVGLVGLPNAGKSTLLSVVSAAKPKIANYPFTTLAPQVGIVQVRAGQTFVMADIPGIIEGASEGRGIGLRFLRHIERNSVLLFLISAESPDIEAEYRMLLGELEAFNPELLYKRRMLAITKSDLLDDELETEMRELLPADLETTFISSLTMKGIVGLKDMLWRLLHRE